MPPEFQMYIVYSQKDTQVNRPIDGHQIRKHVVSEEGVKKRIDMHTRYTPPFRSYLVSECGRMMMRGRGAVTGA